MLNFEFDESKSQTNLEKHGIDFVSAQSLWKDDNLLELKARSDDEPRYLVVGLIDGKHWSAVMTYRQDEYGEKTVRLISVRRSRKQEVLIYES